MSLKPQTKIMIQAANTTDGYIAASQTVLENEFVQLNGVLSETIVTGQSTANILKLGYSRNISITSAGDLSAVTFVIKGTQNGASVTGNVVGPNNNTAVSSQIFDTIISIQVTAAPANAFFTIGLSVRVATRPLRPNWDNPNFNPVAYGLSVINPNEATTKIYATQIMTYGTAYQTMTASLEDYGIYLIKAEGNEKLSIVPFGEGTYAGEYGTSTFWDAFFVTITFQSFNHTAQVWFPQIGR
jgi:hypothetical protein